MMMSRRKIGWQFSGEEFKWTEIVDPPVIMLGSSTADTF